MFIPVACYIDSIRDLFRGSLASSLAFLETGDSLRACDFVIHVFESTQFLMSVSSNLIADPYCSPCLSWVEDSAHSCGTAAITDFTSLLEHQIAQGLDHGRTLPTNNYPDSESDSSNAPFSPLSVMDDYCNAELTTELTSEHDLWRSAIALSDLSFAAPLAFTPYKAVANDEETYFTRSMSPTIDPNVLISADLSLAVDQSDKCDGAARLPADGVIDEQLDLSSLATNAMLQYTKDGVTPSLPLTPTSYSPLLGEDLERIASLLSNNDASYGNYVTWLEAASRASAMSTIPSPLSPSEIEKTSSTIHGALPTMHTICPTERAAGALNKLTQVSTREYQQRSDTVKPPAKRNLPPADPHRPFQCELCPSAFGRRHDLKRHVRIHLGIRPYECGTCGRSFTRVDALNRHNVVKNCAVSTDKL